MSQALAIYEAMTTDARTFAQDAVKRVNRFEQGQDVRTSSVAAIRSALEKAGAVFVSENEASLSGGAGVRLRG